MRRHTFVALTLVCHAALAAGIAVHARWTGRRAGRWPPATLVLGVFGVVGYALEGRRREREATSGVE